ncbi:dihydrolipoamide acetyltransferase family protein [Nonomuraea endophytica]|uniref:Dihydrolipoamide acetyltransferase component of pyruvate dehydrogenase complex n=1 Tax=Nonomuraea endophytica TaxID=714136 RepID=A0A7W8A3K7_9ACTN|nr:dihydrolipoamide acetyltransferase family protein [Nonomuraea endophytica]MBB5078952.1 pyruvate dehydrogenase E2 component (dihydrolipoamide acetyltransferase) [Nonomuraea endophytica]
MARVLRMPEVAAGAIQAILQGWSVAAGAPFGKGEVIATVETDKAVVEVEAEEAGVLLRTLVEDGATVEVGAPIAVLGTPGEPPDTPVPDIPEAQNIREALKSPKVPDVPVRALPDDPPAASEPPVTGPAGAGRTRERVFTSPLARRLAKEAGLRVEDIPGSGPNGRVVRRDVEAVVAASVKVTQTPGYTEVTPTPGYTEVPHTPMRRAIAARLTESKRTAPHFYVRGTARADALLAMRAQLNQGGGPRVSVNDLIVKAAAHAHVRVPAMNVTWTDTAVRAHTQVDIAVAVATPGGLLTPVLRAVERAPVSLVATTLREYGERARTGRLRQDELEGGTLTVTNLGMHGTEEFAAIVNPPQAAILAVGAARQAPVVQDGAVVAATVLSVTLSVDHRPVDGVVAAEWLRVFLSLLENPLAILA